jgi:hypothetical protein
MKIALKTNLSSSTKRWGKILAAIFIFGTLFTWFGAVLQFYDTGKLQPDMLLVLLLMIPIIPVCLIWLIPPMFFEGYPTWIVGLFGEKFLTELV